MDVLNALFPASNYALLGVILLLPLLGAIINGVFGKRLGKEAVTLTALTCIGLAFVFSLVAFLTLWQVQHHAEEGAETAARFYWHAWRWMELGGRNGAPLKIEVAFSLDALNATMALIVTGVGFLIHLYSTKYMEEDPGFHRFFAYLNLFIFSMLVLILGDSLPILFVGWEGVGLCSYLLIGFWFHETANAQAGKKAFITNRIGDFGLLVAMGLLVYYAGALDWTSLEAGAKGLVAPIPVWPIGGHLPLADIFTDHGFTRFGEWLNAPRYVNAATLIALSLFVGCAGKSAQLPLYVWLPDAMAGPTPVSALIHAATMVTAGIYLVCRLSFIFVLSPVAMFSIALIGALTALFAATIALVQNDIKKVLAYSTVSQLGYMFLGVGVGAFTAGFFHVLTHAFFKACLFLCAGSVIHAMHARIHGTEASQDMRNMGGLYRYMPETFWPFCAAWLAIIGAPLFSGFFSKDEILFKALTSSIKSPVAGGAFQRGSDVIPIYQWPSWGPPVLYALGILTALLTAFYMTRLFIGIFFGDFKGWKIKKRWKAAHDDHGHDDHHHEEPGALLEGPKPHESPWQMTIPLAILGVLSVIAGYINIEPIHVTPLEDWLEPVFKTASASVVLTENHESMVMPLLVVAVVIAAAGAWFARFVYIDRKGEIAEQLAERFPGLHRLVYDKWRIDELYDETIIGAVDALADAFVWFDKWVVDGILARFTAFIVMMTGTALRYIQVGRVQAYAAFMVFGLAAVGCFVAVPGVEGHRSENHESGKYALTLSSGLGERTRWDANGDGKWDDEKFGEKQSTEFSLEVAKTRTVRVEVENAFGWKSQRAFTFFRPRPDASSPSAAGALPRAQKIRVNRDAKGRAVGEVLDDKGARQ